MRRIVVACAAAAIAVATVAAPAPAHVPAGRIVILIVDGTGFRDWLRAGDPQIQSMMRDGAAALLSAKTAAPPPRTERECLARSMHGLETLLQGRPSMGVSDRDLRDTALGRALARHDVTAGVARAVVSDATFPGGRRTDFEAFSRAIRNAPSVAILPVADTLAADCRTDDAARAGWIDLSLRRTGELIAVARSVADQVMLVSTVPPVASERDGNHLTALAMTGGPPAGGSLRSATTRRDGVVSLTDVGATTTALLRVGESVGVGSPVRGARASGLAGLEERFRVAASMHRPFSRGTAAAGATAVAIGFLLVVAGRGRAPHGRLPVRTRGAVCACLAAIAAVPGGALIAGAVSTSASAVAVVAVAVATAAALGGYALARPGGAVAAGATVSFVAAAIDAAAGGALSAASPMASGVAAGTRFAGLGDASLGALIAGAALWAAATLDASPRAARAVVAVLGAAVVVAIAPGAGARPEAAVVAVPALGIVAARGLGVRVDRTAALAVAIATALVSGGAVAWRRLTLPGALPRPGVEATWIALVAALSVPMLLLVLRRRALLARALWGQPNLRIALAGCAMAVAAGVACGAAGAGAAGTAALIGVSGLLSSLLAGGGGRR